MCTWIKVSDKLPQLSDKMVDSAILFIEENIYPLLLWDAYDESVGELHIGGFENDNFYVDEIEVDNNELNITHWAKIQPPE